MVKRTIGFNWGAAGLGMSEWGGCHLADVLAAHGVSTDPATWDDGRHVCFRGPDKELPAGADGSYGTSLCSRRRCRRRGPTPTSSAAGRRP